MCSITFILLFSDPNVIDIQLLGSAHEVKTEQATKVLHFLFGGQSFK